jgi:hypothetical protein
MSSEVANNDCKLPCSETMNYAWRISIVEDKPIQTDYWLDSLESKIIIGVRESGEKLLIKNKDEYTSPIAKIFNLTTEYIVMTENTIYIVDAKTPAKRITS